MDTIVAKYQWTVEELTKAHRWHYRQSMRPIFRAAYCAMIVFTIVSGVGILLAGHTREGAIIVGLTLLLLLFFQSPASLLARLQFRRNPDRNQEIEWRLSPQNIQIVSPRGTVQADWNLLIKVAECPDGLLFYFTSQAFNWLPRTGFANDMEYASAVTLARKNCQTFGKCDRSLLQGFRFSLQNILWATFWVCIWAGALSYLIAFIKVHTPLQGLPWSTMLLSVWTPLFLIVWSPAVAIGALFNNARRGALIGLIPIGVIAVLAFIVAI